MNKKTLGILVSVFMIVPVLALAQTGSTARRANFAPPAVRGTVASISGTTITLTGSNGTTYSVDAGNATLTEMSVVSGSRPTTTAITLAQVNAGDTLTVLGTASGSSITASRIIDGALPAASAGFGGKNSGKSRQATKVSPAITNTTSVSTISGTVASPVSGESISLTASNGTGYTVDATNAKILRKYGATMAVTDIQTGDSLSVRGTVSGSTVAAATIRDNSQQQRNATFSGTVSSVDGQSFVLATKQRGSQTFNTTSATVFKENGQTSVSIANVLVGENVTASGVWDSTSSTTDASKVTIVVKSGTTTGVFVSANSEIITMTAYRSSSTVFSVDATNAKLVRRYGAAMQLSDMQAGDVLAVSGIINGLNITAKTIRDESLQAHNGTFVGTVGTVNGGNFILQSKNRGGQTINITGTTIFREGTASTGPGSIAQGQTATVSGVWDRTNSNVTATRVTIKVGSLSATGVIGSLSGSTFTVTTASSTVYSVDATNARITYKNGRKGNILILQNGDNAVVYGKSVSGSLNIIASLVRDTSQTYTASSTAQ
jgi:hypothetical protein